MSIDFGGGWKVAGADSGSKFYEMVAVWAGK